MSCIHLIRHARSAHVDPGTWFRADGITQWEDAYDAAGILDEPAPSPALCELAARADVLAASDLLRAIASAERLAPGRDVVVRPELRELRTAPFTRLPVALPMVAWGTVDFARWTLRLRTGTTHAEFARADAAASWLVEQALGERTVVAVTHGGIRRLIESRLLARGLRPVPGSARTYENWSDWSYAPG